MYDQAAVDEAVDGDLDNLLERARGKRLAAESVHAGDAQPLPTSDNDEDDRKIAEMLEEQKKDSDGDDKKMQMAAKIMGG